MADITVGYLESSPTTSNGVSGAAAHFLEAPTIFRWAQTFSGGYKISGVCLLDGVTPMYNILCSIVPVVNDIQVLDAVYSAEDGTFEFIGIAPGSYCVAGHQRPHTVNSVWKVNIEAVPI